MNRELDLNLITRVAIGDIFRRKARAIPEKIAIVEKRNGEKIRLTYKELNNQVNRFARAIRGLGLKKGDRVAGLCLNSYEYVIASYGLAKGGFVWVPLNPGLKPEDIAGTINDSESKALIVDDQLAPIIPKIKDEIKGVKIFISIPVPKKTESETFVDFHDFIKDESSDEVEDVIIHDRDPCQLLYTSGATALPKAVLQSHLALFIASLTNLIEIELPTGFHNLSVLPIFHCAEQTFINSSLHSGSKSVIMHAFDPKSVLEAIQEEGITITLLLPAMWRALLDYPDFDRYNLSSLKKCVYAMTPMDPRTLEECVIRFGGADFMLGTGQTECWPITNLFKPKWQLLKRGNYWGESNLVQETAVMDEKGRILPPGEVGEIVWRGPNVMNEYCKNPEATEESRRFGWHHSGDLGMFDEDGLLQFVDRKKDMIKSGGENVASIKVERALLADSRVESVAIVGLPHERWIEAVTAFVVCKEGVKLTEDDVITLCKQELAVFEVPKKVVFVQELPKITTGKLEKFKIRAQYKDLFSKE